MHPAAAESMQDQAANLVQVVSVFRTGQSVSAAPVKARGKQAVRALPAKSALVAGIAPPNRPKNEAAAGDDWEQF